MIRRIWCVLALSGLLSLGGALAARAQEGPAIPEKVSGLLDRLDSGGEGRLWNSVNELEELGPAAVSEIAKGLSRPAMTRIGVAKALLTMEGGEAYRSKALGVLRSQIFGKESRKLRLMASELYMSNCGKSDKRSLRKQVDAIDDAQVKISVLKGLRSFGRRKLKEFLASDDANLRAEAALALAEIGNVESAKAVLDRLKAEPTERGRRARLLLAQERLLEQASAVGGLTKKDDIVKLRDKQIARLKTQLALAEVKAQKAANGGGGGSSKIGSAPTGIATRLVSELVAKVRSNYVTEAKVAEKTLANYAAKGILENLDPFSSYMTEEETKSFQESIRQVYAGIGAVVQMDPRTGYLTIVRPIYGGPAFKGGLRTLDRVLEVEGVSTRGKTVRDLVKVLKGKQGTEVAIKVRRFFAPKDEVKDMSITRSFISLPSVSYDLLPGKIGYLQLAQFGYRASQEVENALRDLERRGMVGLIFDLRGNPGGLLNAAVQIAEKFLPAGKLIVYQQGRKGTRVGRRKEFRTRKGAQHPNYPIVVLVNEQSASASEIVSGALSVHKRALLVGKRTFGKGSVQQLYNVETTGGKSTLRLTIAYYYLPDGTLIHRHRSPRAWRFRQSLSQEISRWQQDGIINAKQSQQLHDIYKPEPGGVPTDFDVSAEELTKDERIQLGKLQASMLIESYIQSHYKANQKLFHKLAVFDNEDSKAYPDFATLVTSIREKVSKELSEDRIRIFLRQNLRRFVQDDLGRNLPSDFIGDRQMERAIYEVAHRGGIKASSTPEYRRLAERCQKIDKKKAADEAAKKAELAKKAKESKEGEKKGKKGKDGSF